MISAWRSGDITRSPDISATGSPGRSRMKEKAMMETPMKVGIRTASRPRRNRSMSEPRRVRGSRTSGLRPAKLTKGRPRRERSLPVYQPTLLGDVDAVEA